MDVRRHAERANGPDAIGALSAAGFAMAGNLRPEGPGFAFVISSPLERARDTAMAIASRVDEIEPLLGGSPDEALTQAQYDAMRSQGAVADLLRDQPPSRLFADQQLMFWEAVGGGAADGGHILLITHGGNIELPAVLLATRLGTSIDPLPLDHCEGVRLRFDQGRIVALSRLWAN